MPENELTSELGNIGPPQEDVCHMVRGDLEEHEKKARTSY